MKQTVKSHGFTLIELIVVIAVIGILATITAIGFGKYQSDTRDTRRATSASAIAESLEKYYDKNGEYPSCSAVTAAGNVVSKQTLIGIDAKTIITPQAPSGTDNSIKCTSAGNILTTNGSDFFEYQGDGSTSCNTTESCLQYTLKYKKETTPEIISISSRRSTSIATSGKITNLTANSTSFTTISLAWQQIPNITSYTLEQSNDSGFTSGVIGTDVTVNSAVASGLTAGNTYYYRVRPIGSVGLADWSNTASATTRSLATPVITATTVSNTQLKVTWPDILYETSYTLQYSTTGTNWTSPVPTTISGIAANTTSYIVSGLSTAVTYYFRLQALAAADTSDWSANASATTIIPAPVCSATGGGSNTQIIPTWGASVGAVTYTVQYGPGNYNSQITGISGTSRTINGLNNGTTYTSRVQAVNGANTSAWANCPNRTTGVDGPTSAGWSADAYAVRDTASVAWMPGAYPGAGTYWTNGMYITGTCQPGATIVTRLYQYYAYSNNTTPNNASLMDWTFGTQDRYVVGGRSTWMVFWQGWVACQVGSTRAGDTYLGNAGPY
ncbi:fibronectin type III domain-containing protein [Candidatus Saccharibacteria bacterium]|nr:fibronectin type III domain-containing protein [Candidatus Saccharibacteria bacterium]